MVLEILTHTRQVHDHRNTQGLQVLSRTDAGKQQ